MKEELTLFARDRNCVQARAEALPFRDSSFDAERYEPSLSLAFAIAKLFEKPIEAIFRPGRQQVNDQFGGDRPHLIRGELRAR